MVEDGNAPIIDYIRGGAGNSVWTTYPSSFWLVEVALAGNGTLSWAGDAESYKMSASALGIVNNYGIILKTLPLLHAVILEVNGADIRELEKQQGIVSVKPLNRRTYRTQSGMLVDGWEIVPGFEDWELNNI